MPKAIVSLRSRDDFYYSGLVLVPLFIAPCHSLDNSFTYYSLPLRKILVAVNRCLFVILIVFSGNQFCFTQALNIQFVIVDQSTLLPVSDVHIFVNNASFGINSDVKGQCSIQIPVSISGDLILSHIAYDTKIIPHDEYHILTNRDTIQLSSNGVDLTEIVVHAKRSRKWKRNFKKFKSAFLGNDQIARKCQVLNPEVLIFYDDKNEFRVEALDQIVIRNNFLKYEIDFVLRELTIKNDGSVRYFGYANYRDIANRPVAKIMHDRRNSVYKSSPRHFYRSLIQGHVNRNNYQINKTHYKNGSFVIGAQLTKDDILKYDSIHNIYLLTYDAYLQITNYNIKDIVESQVSVRSNGLESQKFGGTQSGSSTKIEYAVSQLYKITPVLYLNPMGNILNSEEVQEIGFWANQRMSQALPFNFGINYTTKDRVSRIPISSTTKFKDLDLFKALIYTSVDHKEKALLQLRQNWNDNYFAPLLDIVLLSTDKLLVKAIIEILHFNSDQNIVDFYSGLQWLWSKGIQSSNDYSDFKAEIYRYIDPKFKNYFKNRQKSALINLNEIVWGGVKQDGIPPLRFPKLVEAVDADHLSDKEIVFGIKIENDARAYPKRILAWHEFVVDSINGKYIAGVYCTLCGTVIAYDMTLNDVKYELGTSGFLYRSNKLMYDKKTQSLWSTIEGKPVLGPLVGKNIELNTHPIVTTTWKEWKSQNPSTKVLSSHTGYNRNYNIGEAYKSYYATDELMFPVPYSDQSLKNKEEVFIIRAKEFQKDPLAIAVKYLKKNKLIIEEIAQQKILVLTNKQGASRAYAYHEDYVFKYKRDKLRDQNDNIWIISEDAISSPSGVKMKRISSHNIFWFGWYNVYPNTRLIK